MISNTQRLLNALDLMIDVVLSFGLFFTALILFWHNEWDRGLLCLIASYLIELGLGKKLNRSRQDD